MIAAKVCANSSSFNTQADGAKRDQPLSRGLGDGYKRNPRDWDAPAPGRTSPHPGTPDAPERCRAASPAVLYPSVAADEEDSVLRGGHRFNKKTKCILKTRIITHVRDDTIASDISSTCHHNKCR